MLTKRILMATAAIAIILAIMAVVLLLKSSIGPRNPPGMAPPPAQTNCGNGACERGETAGTCTQDCRITDSWITISPNKRYLMFENGASFLPMGPAFNGFQINLDYFGTVQYQGAAITFPTNHFENYFREMKQNGENFLRIDIGGMGYWGKENTKGLITSGRIQFIEDPAGSFNEDYAKRVDRLFSLAEENGIYIELVLLEHSCDLYGIQDLFYLHPYHKTNGGPVNTVKELLTDSAARGLWKKRMEYIVDRWGDSPNLAMWELTNELYGCHDATPESAAAWVEEMGTYLRDYETQKYGKAHLIAVSPGGMTYQLMPTLQFFYDSTGLDIMTTHYYTDISPQSNPVLCALEIHERVPEILARIGYGRPHMDNERTIAALTPKDLEKENEHYAAWAFLASGSATPGFPWMYLEDAVPTDFRNYNALADTHRAMRRILADFDFANFDSKPADARSSNPEIVPMVVTDGYKAIGWLMHNGSLDFTIERINRWRSSTGLDEPMALPEWIALVESQGIDVDLAQLTQRVGAALSDRLSVPLEEGITQAEKIFEDPRLFAKLIKFIKNKFSGEEVLAQATDVIDGLKQGLESIESEHHILENLYTGHPQVSTNLTLSLNNGTYEIVWYDDDTGEEITWEIISGGMITFETPTFSKHIAFMIRPVN